MARRLVIQWVWPLGIVCLAVGGNDYRVYTALLNDRLELERRRLNEDDLARPALRRADVN